MMSIIFVYWLTSHFILSLASPFKSMYAHLFLLWMRSSGSSYDIFLQTTTCAQVLNSD